MVRFISKITKALVFMALTFTAAWADMPSPQILEEPLRVFMLNSDLSPDSGFMLESGMNCSYSPKRWLCAESATNQAMLFSPPANNNETYIKLQLSRNGSSYTVAEPQDKSSEGDLFVRLPGDAAVVCRYMPEKQKHEISVGMLGHRQGEYVWEKYEDSLKNWARKAAIEPQRPDDPPSIVPSSMADRLWFLSTWLKKAGLSLASDDVSKREEALREAAMWEVMRIRPLDGWAYGIKDYSSRIGSDCLNIEDNPEQETNYCQKQGAGRISVSGPAVLLLKYRPEIRLEPTPVLEDGLLQVFRDGQMLFSDPVPFYPDYVEYDKETWSVEAELRRTADGAVLGRTGSIKVLLPAGSHEIEFQLGDKPVWWSLSHARHISHLEDVCNENLGNKQKSDSENVSSLLNAAESYYRLGMCSEAEKSWTKLRNSHSIDPEIDYIIDFRLASCRAEGEILTPDELSLAFARLGVEASIDNMHWEDRRDELFRMNQLEDAMLAYSYSSPGAKLEDIVSSGEASSAQKIALSALWHLDGIWQELAPPAYMFSDEYSLFQNRRLYPDMDALPGGISLLHVESVPVWTSSRLIRGAMRSTTILTSGEVYPVQTIMQIASRKVVLNDAQPLNKHELLTDDEIEVAKITGVRDVWLQQRMLDDETLADAKLVSVYPYTGNEEIYFEMPLEAYSGYALLQVFPVSSVKSGRELKAVIKNANTEQVVSFNFSNSESDVLPLVEGSKIKLAQPLSLQFPLDSPGGVLGLRLEGTGTDKYFVRLLLRMPRQLESEGQAAEAVQTPYTDPEMLAAETAAIEELSVRLNSGSDDKNTPYYHYERALKLCRMGRAGLAREDLLASGKSAGQDAVLREALIELRDRLDSGQCNDLPIMERSLLPIPLDAGVESDSDSSADLTKMKRKFVALSTETDEDGMAKRFDLCSRMAAIDEYEAGCLPWFMETVARRLLKGKDLPPSFFGMLVRYSAWQEKAQWPGSENTLALLWDLSHWESISSVESMDGLETVNLNNADELQQPAGEYAAVVEALLNDGSKPEPWRMFEGQSLMLHLPVPAQTTVGLEFRCSSINPSVSFEDAGCGIEVNADGIKFGNYKQPYASENKPIMLNFSSGDHMLEIRHTVRHSIAAQVLSVRVFSDVSLPGIPSQASDKKYYIGEEPRYTFMRSSASYPVSFRILGPTVLRVDSWNRDGQLSDIKLEVNDENGENLAPLIKSQPGRQDVWLTEKREYAVRILPMQNDHALLQLYFREENSAIESDVKQLRASHSTAPNMAEVTSPSRLESHWLENDEIQSIDKSSIGTGSLLVGYRRLLRDETGYVEPIDQYLLARIGYSRRIENADLWLGISSEGRMRFSANDSLAFDGRLYWITPGPEIHFDLQDRFALQDVSTGAAGGNMLELTVKRPFEILPHWDVTPLLSGYYKWQGINDWREDQIQPYTDADVYSPYNRDHPYTVSLGAGTFYTPFVNNSFFARILAQSNSDFISIDNVQVRAGDLFAFERFQGVLFYDIKPRFADDDREDFSLRHQLHVGAQYSWWPHPFVRLAPVASYDFYPHAMQHAFFGGLLLELSPERGLRDSPPGDEAFPWEIDPERYWVKEW